MTDKKSIEPGPIGVAVAQNVEKLRESRNLSYAELSRRLTELGRPIAPLGLTRTRDRQRRVDVDDLVALALALDVSPATLLLPPAPIGGANANASVTERGGYYPRRQIWNWLIAEASIDAPESMGPPSRSVLGFRVRAVPDGVGPRNFLTAANVRGAVEALRRAGGPAAEYIESFLEKDDDDDGDG